MNPNNSKLYDNILDEVEEAFRLFNNDLAETIGLGRNDRNEFFAEVYSPEGEIVSTTTFSVEFH